MKYILTIILFVNITLFGQDEIKKRQFFIGGFLSPDMSYRLLPENNRNSYEIPKFGYTLGVNALYQFNSKTALFIGVDYSNKGQKTKDLDLLFGDQIDPRRGFVFQSNEQLTNVNFVYNVSYIDIPIRLDYYFNKRKIAPFITAGISTNIFIREKIITKHTFVDNHTERNSTINNNAGYYSINPQFQIGAGVDIAMKKSRLRVFPIYRISLSKVHSGIVNQYFYSCGLGLNYIIGL